MRVTAVVCVCVMGLCAGSASGQGGGPQVRQAAPSDRAVDFTLADLEMTFKDMDAKTQPTLRLLEGGSYNVNIRRLSGSETALVHRRTTDVWVVREGAGTLVTGGTLVDPKVGANGDASGSAIRGGVERVIKVGDVIFIPPGVAHGIKDSRSITYLNIRFDTK